MINNVTDHGYNTVIKIEPGVIFDVPSSEGTGHERPTPYRYRVWRIKSPYTASYWECVCLSGGHPARHGQVEIFSTADILRYVYAPLEIPT